MSATEAERPAELQRAIDRTVARGFVSRPDLNTFVKHAALLGDVTTFAHDLVAAHRTTSATPLQDRRLPRITR